MRAKDAWEEFRRYAAARGVDPAAATPSQAVDLMAGFYRDVRADDCDAENYGDMLLCEWGTYDWGAGEHTEFSVRRQFFCPPSDAKVEGGVLEDADDYIWHLELDFRFAPTPDLRALGADSRGCESPGELDDFVPSFRASPAYGLLGDRTDGHASLTYEGAG